MDRETIDDLLEIVAAFLLSCRYKDGNYIMDSNNFNFALGKLQLLINRLGGCEKPEMVLAASENLLTDKLE